MTKETKHIPVAIIGFGTAGVNAAIGLRQAGYTGTITAFSDADAKPYSPILTSYYAGCEKTYDECFPWTEEELGDLRVDVISHELVLKLDSSEHLIKTAQGEYTFDKCVVATGATPTTIGFPTVQGDVQYRPLVLRTLEDAQRMKDAFEAATCKRVLVSGASMVALKTLEAALNHHLECTLVGMSPHVLDFNALPEVAQRFERGLQASGVTLRLGQTIQAVKRTSDGLLVTFSNGESATFDEIAVSHGMKSNLDFIKENTLTRDRGLIVDEYMRTSHPDVYAAGDVAQGTELISGEKRIVGIWKNAALQGACAGAVIAAELNGQLPDESLVLRGSIATNTIAVKDTLFISAGTMQLNDNRRVEIKETDDMTLAVIYENVPGQSERIVGFNLTCDHDNPGGDAYDIGAMITLRIEKDLV